MQADNQRRQPMSSAQLGEFVVEALHELKAQDVTVLDVRHLTTVTDTMVIATGRSDRHVRALAEAVVERCKQVGEPPLGREGEAAGEWVLLDLADVVVHVMLRHVREFYELEKLWDIPARNQSLAQDHLARDRQSMAKAPRRSGSGEAPG